MDDYFVSHIKDLKRECIEKDYLTYSSFLGLLEQAKLKREMPYLITDKVRYYAEENAERKILVFLPSYYSSLEEAMEEIKLISLLLISPKSEKFSEAISHRDVLGALMSLGIERETIGDIIIHEKSAYVYVLSSLKEEILSSLDSIAHNKVKVSELPSLICPYAPKYIEKTISVPSNRLDAILSEVFPISRETAKKHIENGNVYASEHEVIKNDVSLKEGEAISLRGYGKFYYLKEVGISKKGKLRILVKKPL